MEFSFVDVSAFFTLGVRMMGTPNSLSDELADTSKSLSLGWSSSYSGILPLPLSGFGLRRDLLSSHGGSFGPLSLVEDLAEYRHPSWCSNLPRSWLMESNRAYTKMLIRQKRRRDLPEPLGSKG